MIRVIIVDDHPVVRRGLNQIVTIGQNMQVEFVCFLVCDMLT
jgi:YesN/AraC family two-component response regulator